MQHNDDGYSRRGSFGGSLVRSMVLIHSPDGTNVYGSRGGEFGDMVAWCSGLKVVKSCFHRRALHRVFIC